MRAAISAITILLAVFLSPLNAGAQPARVYVEGGPKEMKAAVLALMRASSDLDDVPRAAQPEANITLQKKGGANVKCGSAKTFLQGPTAADIVAQFREWLSGPLATRRAQHAARAEYWSQVGDALAAQEQQRAATEANSTASAPRLLRGTYRGEVKRLAKDLYEFRPEDRLTIRVIVKTRFCFEPSSGDGVLDYQNDLEYGDSKLVFVDSRSSCAVAAVVR